MTKENKDLLMKLLQQHKALGISDQIDFDKFYLYSIITNSVSLVDDDYGTDIDQFVKSTTEKVVDKLELKRQISEQREPSNSLGRPSRDEIRRRQMVDKWSIKPSLAEKMVDILEFVADKDLITTEAIVSHFGFNLTTAKRYLRQLTEFGYLESHGGNKNRTYSKK